MEEAVRLKNPLLSPSILLENSESCSLAEGALDTVNALSFVVT